MFAGGKSVGDDLWCMMPAMAAAGPVRDSVTGLDCCSGSVALSEIWGDNAACGELCSTLPVISI